MLTCDHESLIISQNTGLEKTLPGNFRIARRSERFLTPLKRAGFFYGPSPAGQPFPIKEPKASACFWARLNLTIPGSVWSNRVTGNFLIRMCGNSGQVNIQPARLREKQIPIRELEKLEKKEK